VQLALATLTTVTDGVNTRCWNHRNINEATHRHTDRFFSGVNMTLMNLLMEQGLEGDAMDNEQKVLKRGQTTGRASSAMGGR
jgi:hypothetical protein